jgi:hypothetical protein
MAPVSYSCGLFMHLTGERKPGRRKRGVIRRSVQCYVIMSACVRHTSRLPASTSVLYWSQELDRISNTFRQSGHMIVYLCYTAMCTSHSRNANRQVYRRAKRTMDPKRPKHMEGKAVVRNRYRKKGQTKCTTT